MPDIQVTEKMVEVINQTLGLKVIDFEKERQIQLGLAEGPHYGLRISSFSRDGQYNFTTYIRLAGSTPGAVDRIVYRYRSDLTLGPDIQHELKKVSPQAVTILIGAFYGFGGIDFSHDSVLRVQVLSLREAISPQSNRALPLAEVLIPDYETNQQV